MGFECKQRSDVREVVAAGIVSFEGFDILSIEMRAT